MALLPADRAVPWTPGVYTGVIGGIPTNRATADLINVTHAPYNADPTGVADCLAAYEAAYAAAIANPAKKGVYFPEGEFRFSAATGAGREFSGKTVRGAGMLLTRLKFYSNSGFNVGTDSSLWIPDPAFIITTGLTKGSTTIGPNPVGWPIGSLLKICVQSDDSVPVISTGGYDVFSNLASPTNQWVRVTSVDPTGTGTVSFWPPLYDDYGGGSLEVRIGGPSAFLPAPNGIGLEDLTVDMDAYPGPYGSTGSYNAVAMSTCYNCWFKNVRAIKPFNYAMSVAPVVNCQFTGCYAGELKGSGSNGAGFLFTGYGCLIEDSAFINAFPSIECNHGSSGNAFVCCVSNGQTNTNHGPQNRFNIHESCAWAFSLSDGYFGGESEITYYRCNFWTQAAYGTASFRRFTRKPSVIGCIAGGSEIGYGWPNIGNSDWTGESQLSLGDPPRDFLMTATLTTRTDDYNGVLTLDSGALYYDSFTPHYFNLFYPGVGTNERELVNNYVYAFTNPLCTFGANSVLPPEGTEFRVGPGSFYPGAGGSGSYQELDLDVEATAIDKGNYFYGSTTYTPLGPDSLVDSLVYPSAPSFMVGYTWPPYDSANPTIPADAIEFIEAIPAGFRWLHPGEEPPPPEPAVPGGTALSITCGTTIIQN